METAVLISRCREGDESAVEILVTRFQKPLYRLALSILEDPSEAEEAAQDALLSALGALDSYRGAASLNTWLHAITVNICRTRLRKRHAHLRLKQALQSLFRLSADAQGDAHGLERNGLSTVKLAHPEEAVLRSEADRSLWNAVHALDEKHRLPVILRYYHDMPIAEIAQVLSVNEGTVHSRLSIARDRLRALLDANPSAPSASRAHRDRQVRL